MQGKLSAMRVRCCFTWVKVMHKLQCMWTCSMTYSCCCTRCQSRKSCAHAANYAGMWHVARHNLLNEILYCLCVLGRGALTTWHVLCLISWRVRTRSYRSVHAASMRVCHKQQGTLAMRDDTEQVQPRSKGAWAPDCDISSPDTFLGTWNLGELWLLGQSSYC